MRSIAAYSYPPHTVYSIPYTSHSTPPTLHPTLSTSHSPHPTLHAHRTKQEGAGALERVRREAGMAPARRRSGRARKKRRGTKKKEREKRKGDGERKRRGTTLKPVSRRGQPHYRGGKPLYCTNSKKQRVRVWRGGVWLTCMAMPSATRPARNPPNRFSHMKFLLLYFS